MKPNCGTKACKAPLKSGNLCRRRDLNRCPVHGPIIPRNDYGIPLEQPHIDSTVAGSSSVAIAISSNPSFNEQKPMWQMIEDHVERDFDLPRFAGRVSKSRARNTDLIDIKGTARSGMEERISKRLKMISSKNRSSSTAADDEYNLKLRDRNLNRW